MFGSNFFDTPTVISDVYLTIQQYVIDELPLQVRHTGHFQENGAPPHWTRTNRGYVDGTFLGRWIGRNRPLRWPPQSPDLTPCKINDLKDHIPDVLSSHSSGMCVRALNAPVNRWLICFEHDDKQIGVTGI
ncbi:hypothetical protein Trydic_g15184 [Trypoxylus dichotomus]